LLPIDTDKSEDKIPESFCLPPDKHCHHQAYQGLSLMPMAFDHARTFFHRSQ